MSSCSVVWAGNSSLEYNESRHGGLEKKTFLWECRILGGTSSSASSGVLCVEVRDDNDFLFAKHAGR